MTHDEYIVANRNRRVEDVALELSRRKDLDAPFVLRQIEGYQRMRTKVPRWTEVEGIHFPPRLALEQCSGQPAAEYKAKVVERLLASSPPPNGGRWRGADLTGGMGVDFSFIAPLFITRTYVEQRAELVEAARHNFPLLGLDKPMADGTKVQLNIIHGDGAEYLRSLPLTEGHSNALDLRHSNAHDLRQSNAHGLRHSNALDLRHCNAHDLRHSNALDLIFLDPARRDAHGGKTVLIEDCEPNVAALLPLLRAKARFTMVKLSPMLDLHRAIATLHAIAPGCVQEVHVFASGGECKDLLLVISGAPAAPPAPAAALAAPAEAAAALAAAPAAAPAAQPVLFAEARLGEFFSAPLSAAPTIYCADERSYFAFTFEEENAAICPFAPAEALAPGAYLYEPGPALMKAGAFRSVAARYGTTKLHANSHLYVSPTPVADFPGRAFRIERTYSFAKADLKALAADLKAEGGKANLTVRNFPSTVADLRKKLKIKEGGNAYLFATTDASERKIIIRCSKI